MTTIKTFWKRFVASVTALKYKYWHNPFFHSEFNAISLQVFFAFFLIAVVALYFGYLFENATQSLLENLKFAVESGVLIDPVHIIEETKSDIENNRLYFLTASITITAIFSYFIARATLKPVRDSLASQKKFIGNIAHELRTPLSIIKTNVEVTLIDDHIDPRVRAMLLSNVEELDRASEIINNLLNFNNLISPEKINFTQVDLGIVVEKCLRNFKELVVSKQIEILIQKTLPYTVWGNSTALEQVVDNLLKNAITYTPKRGIIRIVVEPDYNGNVLLVVQDNGVGIARDDLQHIFEPFYRVERSRNRKAGLGSGLGLTIVSELVKLHSGRISIKSYPNKGTTVYVLLPYSGQKISQDKIKNMNEVSVDFT